MSTEFYSDVSAENSDLTLLVNSGHLAVEATVQDVASEGKLDPYNLKESLSAQLVPAYAGSISTIDQINANRRKSERIHVPGQRILETEFEEWLYEKEGFDQPRFDYLTERIKNNPDLLWRLTATPNVTVNEQQLLGAAIKFGNDQPQPTVIAPDNILGQYNPEEISGTNPNNGKAFKFKLMALTLNRVNVNLQMLHSMRHGEDPFMEGASPLESISWLNTLRASGSELVGPDLNEATYTPSLALRPKFVKGSLRVPSLHIEPNGSLVIGVFEPDDSARKSIHDSFSLSIRPMIS